MASQTSSHGQLQMADPQRDHDKLSTGGLSSGGLSSGGLSAAGELVFILVFQYDKILNSKFFVMKSRIIIGRIGVFCYDCRCSNC